MQYASVWIHGSAIDNASHAVRQAQRYINHAQALRIAYFKYHTIYHPMIAKKMTTQAWHKFPKISSTLTQPSSKVWATLSNIQANNYNWNLSISRHANAATRFSYNWSYKNTNYLKEDILESLWNFLQFIFNHLSMIIKLNKSNIPIYRNWSTIDREQPFLKPILNRHNSQTTWSNDTKF